jgi:hypothetical protein
MTTADNIQSVFLQQVRSKLDPNVSFADELAENLNISRDSAYRRIRGETILSLDEAKILCLRYGVSLDTLLTGHSSMVPFHYRAVDSTNFTLEKWLKSTLENLEALLPFPDREIIYLANNIPPASYFNSPLLGPFKMFFWMTSLWQVENIKSVKFSNNSVSDELIAIGRQVWKRYTETPRIEIWCEETINTTLHQIEYYQEAGFFADEGCATQLCDEYLSLTREIRNWASVGYKDKSEYKFSLYKNDVLIPDATILLKMGGKQMAMLPCNTMNILTTDDAVFCKTTEKHLMNVISKSNLISTSGEKDRNKFFNLVEERILQTRNRVK